MFDAFGRNHLQGSLAGHFEDRNIPSDDPWTEMPRMAILRWPTPMQKAKEKKGRKAAPEVLVRCSQRWNQKTGNW